MSVEERNGDREELDHHAAGVVADKLLNRVRESGSAVLGVVGGRSVTGIYTELTDRDLPWENIHIFLADERLVPITSEESNWQVVHSMLVHPLGESGRLPRENAHPFLVQEDTPHAGIAAYTDELRRCGGRFDAVVLSAGEDGHTASLFPDHASVRAHGSHYVLVEDAPKPPARRLSASRELLEASGLSVLVFYGDGKADALDRFRDDAISIANCPSKLVTESGRAWVYSDI
jgi:6-phosphogluconolactonase